MRHSHVRRVPAVVALGLVLVAGGVIDRGARPGGAAPADTTPAQPTAAPANALASTWYCAAGTAGPGSPADSTVVIFNPTRDVITGSIHLTGVNGTRGDQALTIPARDRVSIRAADITPNPYIAVLVQLDRGGAIVEHTVSGPNGESAGPCATSASDTWYFAEGSTARSATLVYALFNPFPDDAIVDVAFSTDEGRSAPGAFQGVVVPSSSVVVLDIGSRVRRREHVSAVVRARRGRLIAESIQTHAGDGRRGVALTLGATRPAVAWAFADGFTGPGYAERLHLYNPGKLESRVTVDLVLDQGAVEPFDLRVPAQSRITLDLGNEPRVPKGIAHAISVRVENDQPVVAQRTIDYGPPGPRTGYVADLGSPRPARRWAFAAGGATDTLDEWIAVLNMADGAVRVRIRGGSSGVLETLPGLNAVPIPRGGRRSIRIADYRKQDNLGLLVEANGDVFVERFLYRTGGVGVSGSAGVVRIL